MPVAVARPGGDRLVVSVLVVRVVLVLMLVLECLVFVNMLVVLRQVQPDTAGHQCPRRQQLRGDGLVEERYRQDRADKRRRREVSAGAGRAQVAQRDDEKHETQAIAEKTDEGTERYGTGRRQRSSH